MAATDIYSLPIGVLHCVCFPLNVQYHHHSQRLSLTDWILRRQTISSGLQRGIMTVCPAVPTSSVFQTPSQRDYWSVQKSWFWANRCKAFWFPSSTSRENLGCVLTALSKVQPFAYNWMLLFRLFTCWAQCVMQKTHPCNGSSRWHTQAIKQCFCVGTIWTLKTCLHT